MKNEFKHELGEEYKCKITGFKGVIVSRGQWLTGCNRYGLQAKINKDGKVDDPSWFDEDVIEPTKKKSVMKTLEENRGGPKPNPTKY